MEGVKDGPRDLVRMSGLQNPGFELPRYFFDGWKGTSLVRVPIRSNREPKSWTGFSGPVLILIFYTFNLFSTLRRGNFFRCLCIGILWLIFHDFMMLLILILRRFGSKCLF